MTQRKFWLVSNSPRRREILGWLDWNLETSAANINESRRSGESAEKYVLRLASEKARFPIPGADSDDVIIAADTIVVLDGDLLGKPADAELAVLQAVFSHRKQAVQILRSEKGILCIYSYKASP
jgi:septum formation protein